MRWAMAEGEVRNARAISSVVKPQTSRSVSAERYDELLKELQRKNEALAEAAAHLFLTKKVSRILGGEK